MNEAELSNMVEFCRVFPKLYESSRCPEPGCRYDYDSYLFSTIFHLNDDHKWSREAIADWLDTLDIDLTFPVPSDL